MSYCIKLKRFTIWTVIRGHYTTDTHATRDLSAVAQFLAVYVNVAVDVKP